MMEAKTGFLIRLQKPVSPFQAALILGLFVLTIGLVGLAFCKYKIPSSSTTFTPLETVKQPFTLSLESPVDGALILGNKLLVKGKTLPNTTVVFFTETDANSVESDENGQFEGVLILENGINTLTVNAFSEEGEEKEISLNIVYDEEESGLVKGVKTKKQTQASLPFP